MKRMVGGFGLKFGNVDSVKWRSETEVLAQVGIVAGIQWLLRIASMVEN